MPNTAAIVAFAGSTRKGSWNRLLLRTAVEGARQAGADVTVVELADYPMPFYNADLEHAEGMPATARAFRQLLDRHGGFLIACPEYNGSVPAVLKNAFDWASRPDGGGDGLAVYRGKVAALVGTSIGPYGAVRAIGHLRAILSKVGTNVLAEEATVPNAKDVFGADGTLKVAALDQLARRIGANLALAIAERSGART